MVHDAVDDRCGEFVVREDRAPFTELDVRGEYDAPSFVAARDDLVEQARPVDVEGYVAELVQYDQVGTADVPEHRLERAVAFGLAQLEDELGGLKENVIIGKLIPAGSGLDMYRNFEMKTDESIEDEADYVDLYELKKLTNAL